MNLSELSLRRPVLAVVMNIVIVIFGFIGFKFLGVRDYPAIDPPNVNVVTSYGGANPEIIEAQITEPLEKAINGIAGVKSITSTSSLGRSSINVEFDLTIPLEEAANDVRDKVSQASRTLPSDLEAPPVVSKADASSDYILSMTVQSDIRNQMQITEYANNVLVEKLQTIPGVSAIQILGEKRYAMRILMDPRKLTAYRITPTDVQEVLSRENIELPSGKIISQATELTVRASGRLNTEEEFNNVIIRTQDGGDVRIKDIGEAVLAAENEETSFSESGTPMIALTIIPQPGSNYVEISDEFYRRLAQLKKDMPTDIKLNVAVDQTKYVKKSIDEVQETLIISLILVVLIIYLFFRDWAIALRPLIDIPVSLIGVFFIMYVCGFTINILTMLAVVLATGLVVDDGIVVTENIYKKMEQGMNKWQAAREGSKEIYFAVIATSITLAVVFLPIIFLQGFVGRLFREFGIVVACAVLISAFVSLTLTPVLNVKLTKKVHSHSWFYRKTEFLFEGLERWYKKSLTSFLKVRWVGFILITICGGVIYWVGSVIQSELAPLEDRSQLRVQLTLPEGSSFAYTQATIDKLNDFLMDSIPERRAMIAVAAPNTAGGAVNTGNLRPMLVDPNLRNRTQKDIANMIIRNLSKFPEGRVAVLEEQTIQQNRRVGQAIQFVIQNNDFEKLVAVLPKIIEEANKSGVVTAADADLKFNKPELRIKVNRLKAAQLGVSLENVSNTLNLALSDKNISTFLKSGKQYYVKSQLLSVNRDAPADLKEIFVRNNQGIMISLDNLVIMEESTGPSNIYHFNRYKSATISASLAPGKTIGDGIVEMRRIAKKLLDDTYDTTLSGASRDYVESSSNIGFAFILALVLIYLILAAQFESFIDPIVIMLTVPLAIAGALLSLWMFGQTINIFSQIGMIMLIGLVTKNGILIVEFANQSRLKGMDRTQASIHAASQRLRPILMTSLAMALGALPIALSLGAAATSRIPLGIVIVGGIIFSLLLTLYIIPAMYSYLSAKKVRKTMEQHLESEQQKDSQSQKVLL